MAEKEFGISSSVLKTIAIILMVVNHFCTLPISFLSVDSFLFRFLWCVTRVSYPLFAFMLAEGMAHTHNRQKYMIRLLLLAIISQPVYGWALIDGPLTLNSLNVFFDLLAGGIAITVYDHFKKENRVALVVLLVALCVLSVKFNFSYNILGVLLPLVFYLLREHRKLLVPVSVPSILVLVLAMYCIGYGYTVSDLGFFAFSEFCMVFSLPLILLYNGEKGRQLPKWFYYGFYPVHLAIVGFLKVIM